MASPTSSTSCACCAISRPSTPTRAPTTSTPSSSAARRPASRRFSEGRLAVRSRDEPSPHRANARLTRAAAQIAMDLAPSALLVVAGIAGGVMAAIVGGAAVITFPALLAAGLPPVMATAGNTVALTPGLFLAAIYDRSQLPPFDRSFLAMAVASVAGALIGASLLLLTPERVFSALVPLLLGFATVLFAYAGRISAWLAERAARGNKRFSAHSLAAVLPVSIYGGYFGAGVGVLMLGIFSVGTGGDYRSANVS